MSIIPKEKRKERSNKGLTLIAGGLPGEVEAALARERAPESKPACPPSLSEYLEHAKELFCVPEWRERTLTGKEYSETVKKAVKDFGIQEDEIENVVESSYGFIVGSDNLHTLLGENVGFEGGLFHKIKRRDYKRIDTIRCVSPKRRLELFDMGLITRDEIYQSFEKTVYEQNQEIQLVNINDGAIIKLHTGRWCNHKGVRSKHLRKAFKAGIGEITDAIMLTLGTHEKEILEFMIPNTNMLPIEWAIVHMGKWVSGFLKRLRQWQEIRGMPWEFVGWVLEFQDSDKGLKLGFPHVHMIFRGKWIGKIGEIAKLWPYCPPQGVDYMDKKKYEAELRGKRKLRAGQHCSSIRLINYLTAYVSDMGKAVTDLGIHKGYAWLWFCGGRMYSLGREYKKGAKERKKGEKKVGEIKKEKSPWSLKRLGKGIKIQEEIDHYCELCGKPIFKESFAMVSHLCIPEKNNRILTRLC